MSESESEPEPRGKSLTERATLLFCSLFGIGKKGEGEGKQEMKGKEVDEMSVRPEPPSSPQRREERPVLINRDLAEPMTPQPAV